ncbi:MAG: ATP-dependent DNA helicase RecG [Rikenellaceae bacterium]|jgi:ATP-dependent DNA helicase RecG|nr:ATP-dependent DNA helicase RecG [Rikenellaceae bacterium]
MSNVLDNPVKFVPGVGEKRAKLLEKELGVRTLGDLLYLFPFRYIDRTRIYRIAEIQDDSLAYIQLRARVEAMQVVGTGPKKRLRVVVSDGSGHAELVWFKGLAWIQKRIELQREYIIFGRPSLFNGVLNLVHPDVESTLGEGSRFQPGVQGVYRTTEPLVNNHINTKTLFTLVCNAWQLADGRIEETLPPEIIREYNLMGLRDALYNIHFPTDETQLKAARLRLKFEELLGIQLNILAQRNLRVMRNRGFIFSVVGQRFNDFYSQRLPFALTSAQKRVIKEIRADMGSGRQMNRLLQGDVGSGKTLVALLTMLIANDNGYQASIMAPTEILAHQHYDSITELLGEASGVRVALLTGSTRKKVRDELLEQLAAGQIDILVGTHALLEDRVRFANLGYVVIDEQHRFGVEQRARLWMKSDRLPHILVMTATPIPRTLAMTLYGDLDVSVIDEMPPGRKPVKTVHYNDSHRLRMLGFLKQEIDKGRQVYIVYPLIKESEKMDYLNLEEGHAGIVQAFPPPDYYVQVVHGKMKQADKDYGMNLFKRGQAHILLATSVIEVGVNVPNASVMVIESAERFGLSQLHQLRGRVGRGAEQSYCILMSSVKLSKESRARLKAMVDTTDGFELSELDMQLRGPGDVAGTQQSGMPFELKIASLSQDGQILALARRAAENVLQADPLLSLPENQLLRQLSRKNDTEDNRDFSMIS